MTLKRITDKSVFRPYYRMGGVLRFTVFSGAEDSDAGVREAIRTALSDIAPVDPSELAQLKGHHLTPEAFFGKGLDLKTGKLIAEGIYTTAGGAQLTDPKLRDLAEYNIVASGWHLAHSFTYAFLHPPYGLNGRADIVQNTFNRIRATLLPDGEDAVIQDWSHDGLDALCPWFAAGLEWWGVFLYTLHIPATGQISVITGSATD